MCGLPKVYTISQYLTIAIQSYIWKYYLETSYGKPTPLSSIYSYTKSQGKEEIILSLREIIMSWKLWLWALTVCI